MSTPNAVYMPKRTFLVDAENENFLIRGNEPLENDGSFAYAALNQKLQTILPEGFDLKNYKLITISLIDNNPASEGGDLAMEFAGYGFTQEQFDQMFPFPTSWPPFFRGLDVTKQYGAEVAGNKGSMVWFPVQGCTDENNCKLVEPPQFNFAGLVEFLKHLMTTENKAVVYYHCEHGHDRTSALTAAYMMKYMGRTLEQVLDDKPPEGAKAFKHAWETNYEELVKYYASEVKE
jgi:hypothetical protein